MQRFLIGCSSAIAMIATGLPSNATAIHNSAITSTASFIVKLPLRNKAELLALIHNQTDPRSPLYHHFLTVSQFRARYGASPATVAVVTRALRTQGLQVSRTTSQAISVNGSRSVVARIFAARRQSAGRISSSGATTDVTSTLAAAGANVIGGVAPTFPLHPLSVRVPLNRSSVSGDYWFDDLKQAYSYPSYATGYIGTGITVGIVIDSAVNTHDLIVYGQHERFSTYSRGAKAPTLTLRPVSGGAPTTSATDVYNPNGDGSEAALDMEQLLGSAPGASAIIYDVPNLNDDGVFAGDIDVVEDNAVDLVSESIGQCELAYDASNNFGQDFTGILASLHEIFLQGNAQGITWVAASGDSGNLMCPAPNYFESHTASKFIPSVDSPASDPAVVAVGGTNLVTTPPHAGSLTSKYVKENAYADPEIPYDVYGIGANVSGGVFGSGSGPSKYFVKPDYQNLVETHSAMRTTPDISMQMGGCPTGVSIVGGPNAFCGYAPPVYDKQPRSAVVTYYSGPGTSSDGYIGLIGTSASAPEFAGLLAIKAQTLGSRLGNANELIYSIAAANTAFTTPFYHQGIPGYNGIIRTTAGQLGYSGIVGVGTPYAANFLGLSTSALTGDPQTPSNP